MAVSVAAIVAEAFDAVALELSGVIKAGTLTRAANSTYDADDGTFTASETEVSCRLVDATATPETLFPGYVRSPGEVVLWIEAASCRLGDRVAVSGWPERTITKLVDVVGSGVFFGAVAK